MFQFLKLARLHGSKAVAELKGRLADSVAGLDGRSPRLKSRGRIEGSPPNRGKCAKPVVSTAQKPWPN